MPGYRVTVAARGPVFDGVAGEVIARVTEEAARELAQRGQRDIKAAANAMDKSGRGGTGRAAEGVLLYDRGQTQIIFGAMKEGQVWWPWLEGTSKRNRSTHFAGYHTFRAERRRLAATAADVLEAKLAEHLPEIGGHAG